VLRDGDAMAEGRLFNILTVILARVALPHPATI
jgi:hypothetical protein